MSRDRACETPSGNHVEPPVGATFFDGSLDDSPLQKAQLSGYRIRLLLNCGDEERVKIGMLRFNRPREIGIVRCPSSETSIHNQTANNRDDATRESPLNSAKTSPKQNHADQSDSDPITGQRPMRSLFPTTADDGFKRGFEQ